MAKNRQITSLFKSSEASPFRTCQWPFGDPGTKEFHFCGEPTHAGFSYCRKHAQMAYREPEPRRSAPSYPGRRAA